MLSLKRGIVVKLQYGLVLLAAAAICASLMAADSAPSSQPLSGEEFNRPTYTGNGKYEIQPVTGLYKIQGLEELAGRWGLKPYETISSKQYQRTGRVIFRDMRTGAQVWRITDNPFAFERHVYSNEPSWNCDGSMFVYMSTGSPAKILNGDLSKELDLPQQRVGQWYSGARDPQRPTLFYYYDPARGIVKDDIISGKSEVLYAKEKFEPFFKEFPNRPAYAKANSITPDGQFVVGRAGGASDEGVTFFGAKTDGTELRVARVPEGTGIHNLYALDIDGHKVHLGLAGTAGPAVHDLDTGKCTRYPDAKGHGAWQPGALIKAHETGGHGVNVLDLTTGKDQQVLDAAFYEDYFCWPANQPDFYFGGHAKTGTDIAQVRADGSMTAMRLCTVAPMHPQFGTYNNLSFIATSPDGTKVQFTSTMLGSVDEYLVVANNPQAPRDVVVSSTGGKAVLAWKAPLRHREIAGYLVYRSDESGKGKVCITDKPVKDKQLEVPLPGNGKAQYYVVTSLEHSGLESSYSSEACVSNAKEPWPSDVRIFLEAEDGEMSLPFRPAFGPVVASNAHYALQTKEGEAGKLKLKFDAPRQAAYYFIARLSGNSADSPLLLKVDGGKPAAMNTAVPKENWQWVTWPDALQLTKGPHEIELSASRFSAAIDQVLVTTDRNWRPSRWGTCNEAAPPQVAGLKAAEAGTYDIALAWEPSKDTSVHHYNLYCSSGKDVEASQKYLVASPAEGVYLDWGLKPDTEYRYVITAVDRHGNESKPSEPIIAKTRPHEGKVTSGEWDVTDKDPEGKQSPAVQFEPAEKGQFVIWAFVKGVPEKGRKGAGEVDVSMDGKNLGPWTVLYDQVGLNAGPSKDSDWVWCQFTVTKQKAFGPTLVDVEAGKHEIKLSSTYFRIARIAVSNDLSFRPKGKLNTFYR